MPDLTSLLERIKAAEMQLEQLRPLDKEREGRVMQKFRLWWMHHSNAVFYREPLARDEIRALTELAGRYLLKVIREKTKTS